MRRLSHLLMISIMSFFVFTSTFAQTQLITIGEPVIGEITTLQPTATYSFDGREGDVIYFYISPLQLNQSFYGRLFDANENVIAETTAFPFVRNFRLPATQTYTLLIGNNDNEIGGFQLLVDFYQPTSLVLDTSISDTLDSSAHLDFYTIDVTAGTLFRYSTSGVQLGVSILNPQGELHSFQGTYDSPLLMLSQFDQTGQYLIMMNTDIPEGLDYSLFLESVNPIPLTAGTSVTGSTQVTNPPVFSFQSPAGKAWELNALIPQDGDRRMFIAQLDGRLWYDILIATDSGSGANGNPRINPFIAPADATYYVWLEFSSYQNETAYDYEMLLSSTTILSLAPEVETTQTITPQTGALTFVYTTIADNQRIELSVRKISETGSISLQVLSPVDEIIFVAGRGMNGGVFDLDLPVTGLYRFVVNDIGYESPELVITIRLRQLQDK
mgnify:FL=1